MKFLIVDDIGFSTQLTTKAVTQLGHTAVLTKSATEALRHLEKDPSIDFVITEYQLPDMNGVEFINRSYDLKRFQGLGALLIPPFILSTIETIDGFHKQAISYGFSGVITKPVYAEALNQLILEIKDTHSQQENQKKVMVIDPKNTVSDFLQPVISKFPENQVIRPTSLEDALNIYKKDFSISAIVTTMMIEGFNGIEQMHRFNKIERFNDAGSIERPAMMIVAEDVDFNTMQELKHLGYSDIFLKASAPKGLEKRLTELLCVRKKGKEEVEPPPSILVVDDIGFCESVMRMALQKLGYPILSAKNGVEAFKLIQQEESIAAIVSDLLMPEMNGEELYDNLQTLERKRFPKPGFIIFTACNDYNTLEGLKAKGIDEVIQKTSQASILKDLVGKMVSVRQGEYLSRKNQQEQTLTDGLDVSAEAEPSGINPTESVPAA